MIMSFNILLNLIGTKRDQQIVAPLMHVALVVPVVLVVMTLVTILLLFLGIFLYRQSRFSNRYVYNNYYVKIHVL